MKSQQVVDNKPDPHDCSADMFGDDSDDEYFRNIVETDNANAKQPDKSLFSTSELVKMMSSNSINNTNSIKTVKPKKLSSIFCDAEFNFPEESSMANNSMNLPKNSINNDSDNSTSVNLLENKTSKSELDDFTELPKKSINNSLDNSNSANLLENNSSRSEFVEFPDDE